MKKTFVAPSQCHGCTFANRCLKQGNRGARALNDLSRREAGRIAVHEAAFPDDEEARKAAIAVEHDQTLAAASFYESERMVGAKVVYAAGVFCGGLEGGTSFLRRIPGLRYILGGAACGMPPALQDMVESSNVPTEAVIDYTPETPELA